jgi:hypothetical protein
VKSVARTLVFAHALAALPALACEVPDDGGALPRRLVTRVKHLPQTEAWQKTLPEGTTAQFVLRLDAPQRIRGRCYWPVEVRAGGELWTRFMVSANGKLAKSTSPR